MSGKTNPKTPLAVPKTEQAAREQIKALLRHNAVSMRLLGPKSKPRQ